MYLKIIGLIAIFIGCTLCGMMMSMKLTKRVRQIESFICAVGLIATEIRYFASPVEAIMEKLDQIEDYKQLKVFEICKANLKNTNRFSQAWESAIKESEKSLALQSADYESLLWFGRALGTTDVEGQLANCERCCEQLSQRLIIAREDSGKKGKMYSSLGILAGIFIAVMLF
jgi:stage III sporulation protein AB